MNQQAKIDRQKNGTAGFYGAMGEPAPAAWPIAMTVVAKTTAQPEEAVQAFLNSEYGWSFAEDTLDWLFAGLSLTDALQTVADRWMSRCVQIDAFRDWEVAADTPSLTGYVMVTGAEERAA
ncbi:hypothetical protein [Caldimonas brevitalea]|uniref:Topoisomerase IA n=1 Tax=Caldimonas brevitalea TaxID=413882 RepID=A0A0G3BVW0_9BURK|nr:hypothetical protein [Caldimonas brevitalea]AKJ30665.1 topoisomerase IA [Caldimonas brevitalea]